MLTFRGLCCPCTLAGLRYYEDPEVASLLKKMPEISRLSEQSTSRILMSHVLGKALQAK